MVDAAGVLKPASVGADRSEGGGKGRSAGASLTGTVTPEGGDSGG